MTERSGQGDRMHRSVKYMTVSERAICSDRTLACVRSAPTGRVRSSKTSSRILLMLTGRWHPESGHFCVQHLLRGQQPIHAATDTASVASGEHWYLASGRTLTTAADQMNWPNSSSCVRSQPNQRPVSHLTLHLLLIRNPLRMKLTSIDLRAIPELSSAKFDTCAPHLIH